MVTVMPEDHYTFLHYANVFGVVCSRWKCFGERAAFGTDGAGGEPA
jgi:hypothetical protein